MNLLRNIKNFCRYIVRYPKRLLNTIRLYTTLQSNSYIFIQMSVKWKGLSIVKYNFGDDLNVFLLEKLTGKRVLKYDEFLHIHKENILGIGSIIEYKCNSNSIIWGSGALYGNPNFKVRPSKVLATRGPLTKHYIESFGVECPCLFGDPALLLPLVYPVKERKILYEIGFIPHYSEKELPHIKIFRKKHPEYKFIDLQQYQNWNDIIDDILSCKSIVSSSLHGLIISDAYKIPNVYVSFSNSLAGGTFKFRDYFEGVNRRYAPPLNFRNSINVNKIQNSVEKYVPIAYDVTKLLEVFPYPILEKYKVFITNNI